MKGFQFDYQKYLNSFSWRRQEDEIEKSYIKEANGYISPTISRINKKLGNYNVESKQNRDFIKESARYFYHKMMEDEDWVHAKYKGVDVETLSGAEKDWVSKKKSIYETLDATSIPGNTPLDQAVFLFYSLLDGEENNNSVSSGSNGNVMNMDASQLVQKIGAAADFGELMEDRELEELLDEKPNPRAPTPYKSGFLKFLNKMALIEELGAEFKIEKEVEEKISITGDIPVVRKMTSYNQIMEADLYQFAMPDFEINLANKNIFCHLKVEKTDHIQKIITLIDSSASMQEGSKHNWLSTILINRLRYAIKGEAEFFIFCYREDIERQWHVYDRASAIRFWKEYDFYTNSCGTNVGTLINKIDEKVHSGDFFGMGDLSEEKPEILIISDGQDDAGNTFEYKTNIITLDDRVNKKLKDMALSSGGKYVHIDEEQMEEYANNRENKVTKFNR